jgi:hypothetical protein
MEGSTPGATQAREHMTALQRLGGCGWTLAVRRRFTGPAAAMRAGLACAGFFVIFACRSHEVRAQRMSQGPSPSSPGFLSA